MADDILFKPQAIRRQAPYRGPTSDQDFNDTVDEVLADITDAADAINLLHNSQKMLKRVYQREIEALKERLSQLESDRLERNVKDALAGDPILWTTDFGDLTDVTFSSFAQSRRCRIEPSFGQVTVPMEGTVNRFHAVNPTTQQILLADNINATISATSEVGGTAVAGTPRNAFNGNNTSFWIRQVYYPLSSDVESVTVQLDVDVPARFDTNANMLYLRPFPLGTVDVDSIFISTTTADPTIPLPGFPTDGVPCAGALRYIFATRSITKVRIYLTQRNWVEHDDQKLFMYGLQELGVNLVHWDKTDLASFFLNNGFVQKVTAPDGYEFASLNAFWSTPDYAVPASDSGIHFKIFSDSTLTTEVWDSWSDPILTAVPVSVAAAHVEDLYIVSNLKYDTANQVTPVLTNIALRYTTQ